MTLMRWETESAGVGPNVNRGRGGNLQALMVACTDRLVSIHVAMRKHTDPWGSEDLCEPKLLTFVQHRLSGETLEEELMVIRQMRRCLGVNAVKDFYKIWLHRYPTTDKYLSSGRKGFFSTGMRWNKCRRPPRKHATLFIPLLNSAYDLLPHRNFSPAFTLMNLSHTGEQPGEIPIYL